MSKLSRILLVLLVSLLAGGILFLAMWEIPPPSAPVEKVISNDKVFR